MSRSKISRISFMFPSDPPGAAEFFESLVILLGRDPHSFIFEDLILLTPADPAEALPATSFELAEIPIPKLVLETDLPVDTRIGNFYIHGSEVAADISPIDGEPLTDRFSLMPLAELAARFEDPIRLDHSGLNIPQGMYTEDEWQLLLRDISSVADVYQYPTGEDWYFLLPTTSDEAGGGITRFSPGRAPKFELVYDAFAKVPVVQFQVDTGLSRVEVEERLPEPYGVSFPDLGDIFRTVYVEHPWPDLLIRFDFTFNRPEGGDEWTTGEWLVREGRRLVYAAPKPNGQR
jgi:hypothetical protein